MIQALNIPRSILLLTAALSLTGCGKTPDRVTDTRPQWHGARIDGIAPLMSPQEVQAALTRHGYVQTPCTSEDTLRGRPLYEKARPCFRSPTRPMMINLFFLELNEGRKLAVVNFDWIEHHGASDAKRLAVSRAFVRTLRANLGRPSTSVDRAPDFRSFYWNRPGGRPDQPDTISTTISRKLSPEITMTSMWAYGEARPDP